MSARLVVLGLLRSQPLYGYELKQRIDDTMGAWTNIAFGSIYYALGKLTEEGLIEEVGTEREGRRPSRTVHETTDTERQVRPPAADNVVQCRAAVIHRRHRPDIRGSLARRRGEAHNLQERVMRLEDAVRVLDRREEERCQEERGRRLLTGALFDHQRTHLAAELAWTREVLERVERGAFAMEREQKRGRVEPDNGVA